MKFLINPLFVFVSLWSMIVLLYSFKWSDVLVLDSGFVAYFVYCFIVFPFVIGYSFSYLVPINFRRDFRKALVPLIDDRRLNFFLIFFISVTTLEIILYKGFPLIWFLVGDARGYADYGIPTIHGLVNAVHLVLLTIYFYKALKGESSWIIFIMLIVWCVMMFSRFLIMIAIVQCLFLYMQCVKIKLSSLCKVVLLFFIFFWLFGYVGGVRSGIDSTREFFGITDSYPEFLPPLFIWVYIYLLSPINNLASWYGYGNDDLSMPNLFATLFPSFIRDLIYSNENVELTLVHEAFNMSTGFAPIFADFGLPGLMIYSFLIALWIGVLWRLSRGLNNYFSFAIALQCVFYLMFFNPLFTLPILFQFFIVRYLISYVPFR